MEDIKVRITDSLRVHIDGVMHLDLPMQDYGGLISWIDDGDITLYCIEIYRKNDKPILVEYVSKEVWKDVLWKMDNAFVDNMVNKKGLQLEYIAKR